MNTSEWILVFKVFDVGTGDYVRNETKKSFDEKPMRELEKRLLDKCADMNWIEPHYNVSLTVTELKKT
jgi:hypothetical protein